jgi:hypothetical protein
MAEEIKEFPPIPPADPAPAESVNIDTTMPKRVALRLMADQTLLDKRAEIRKCLDEYVEFQEIAEDTAEAYAIFKTIDAVESGKGVVQMQSRLALDRYIAKWSTTPPGTITISFRESCQKD